MDIVRSDVIKTTPFHERKAVLNETGLWEHWAGHLNAKQYQFSEKQEYFSVRSAAGVYDTTPLYKYRFVGEDAETFLTGALARDPRSCRPGRAQYTIWCDDDGYVIEDGMLFRESATSFLLTAAEPNQAYFEDLVGRLAVEVVDVSENLASLALQGPRSKTILESLSTELGGLRPFDIATSKIGTSTVSVSRTGFTGDLGYELWMDAADALAVWDGLFEVGADHGLVPFGETALIMTRIEAGLLLIGADFVSSRYAWGDGEKSSPVELGLGWMFRDLEKDGRSFVGRSGVEEDLAGRARWHLVGLTIDWEAWNAADRSHGHVPPKDHTPMMDEIPIYSGEEKVGFSSSFMYSPMVQNHIAMAQVLPAHADLGSHVEYEITIDHELHYVDSVVTKMPFYNPPQKVQ